MIKSMSVRAGVNPPFTNHCVRPTTVNILSSRNMKNRHIRAVTGHKSDASSSRGIGTSEFPRFGSRIKCYSA